MGPLLNPKTLISRAPRTQNRSQLVADLWASSGGSRWALAKRQKARDQVAVLGGCSERVSAIKFPDLRENTGNLVGIRPSSDGGRQRLQGIAG